MFDVALAASSVSNLKQGQYLTSSYISNIYPESVCFHVKFSQLDIDESDVLQGNIGDCWLLSSLSTIAAICPNIIKNLFVYSSPNKGFSIVRLLGHDILIDHQIPIICDALGVVDVVGPKVSKQNEYWPIVLEKAFISLFNSQLCPPEIKNFNFKKRLHSGTQLYSPDYMDVNGGFPRWALSVILNTHIDPLQTKKLDILDILKNKWGKTIACACTSTEKDDNNKVDGFVYGHAYSVLSVDEEKQLIRVRNPWGKFENTKYDDGVDDGSFLVDIETFKKRFPLVCLARVLESASARSP